MPDAHTFSQGIGLLVILYLAGLLVIAHRLKTAHNPVWVGLGSPSLLHWSISNSFQLGAFVFVRSAYRRLADRTLGCMVWTERSLFLLTVAAIAFWKFHYR
jgi:hypothetical protein